MHKKSKKPSDNGDSIGSSSLYHIKKYIQDSTVRAHNGRKCVDGRYLPDQDPGMIARPGGDCGYVMALMAVNKRKKLGMTPEQCFNAVYKAVQDERGFCMHTDHHVDPDEHTHAGLIGCGHLAKAANRRSARSYDVDGEEVKRIVDYARNLLEISPTVHMINLDGEHEEKGVLIIHSTKHTVLADNPKLKQMYFIYDELRDNEFIKKLVHKMHISGVTYEDMKYESDLQLRATLQNLALGLPMYKVTYVEDKPMISYVGTVKSDHTLSGLHLRRRFTYHVLPKLQRITHHN